MACNRDVQQAVHSCIDQLIINQRRKIAVQTYEKKLTKGKSILCVSKHYDNQIDLINKV